MKSGFGATIYYCIIGRDTQIAPQNQAEDYTHILPSIFRLDSYATTRIPR